MKHIFTILASLATFASAAPLDSGAAATLATGKPDDYRKQLIDFVKKTRGAKPSGKRFPRRW